MTTPRLRLGQLLVDARLITAAALDEVLVAQRTDGRRLGALLIERGLINETQLTQILSHQLSVPWVSLLHIEFSRQLLNLVPRDVADRFCLVPIYVRHVRNQGDTLYVAMEDPTNEEGLRACREHAGLPVRSMIAPPTDIRSAIRVYYGVDSAPLTRPIIGEGPAAPSLAPPTPVAMEDTPAAESPARPVAARRPTPQPESSPISSTPETRREPAVQHARDLMAAGAALQAPAEPPVPPEPAEAKAEPAEAKAEPAEPSTEAPGVDAEPPVTRQERAPEGPHIEAVEADGGHAEQGILEPELPLDEPPPPSSPMVENIPLPRGRTPRMVSLTLLDGTTINLPAKRRRRRSRPDEGEALEAAEIDEPPSAPPSTEPPSSVEPSSGLTARDLVLALRVVAHGADASEVLGENIRWEALFSALLSLMLKKRLIADWEFIDELKKQL
jgi:hypothetical protein